MSLRDRENNRRSSVVGSIISGANTDVNSTIENIESGNNIEGEKEAFKPKSYYISKRLYQAIGIRATLASIDKSEVVRRALTEYLKDILEEYKEVLK